MWGSINVGGEENDCSYFSGEKGNEVTVVPQGFLGEAQSGGGGIRRTHDRISVLKLAFLRGTAEKNFGERKDS